MAKVYKVEFYIADPNDFYDDGYDLIHSIKVGLYEGFMLNPEWKTSKEFEWEDNIDLNYYGCSKENCEKYFIT